MVEASVLRRVLHFAPTSIEMPDDDAEGIRNVTPTPDRPVIEIKPPEPEGEVIDIRPQEPSSDDAGVSAAFDLDGKQE